MKFYLKDRWYGLINGFLLGFILDFRISILTGFLGWLIGKAAEK